MTWKTFVWCILGGMIGAAVIAYSPISCERASDPVMGNIYTTDTVTAYDDRINRADIPVETVAADEFTTLPIAADDTFSFEAGVISMPAKPFDIDARLDAIERRLDALEKRSKP